MNLLSCSRNENITNMQNFVLELYKTSNVEKVLVPDGITLMNPENKRCQTEAKLQILKIIF